MVPKAGSCYADSQHQAIGNPLDPEALLGAGPVSLGAHTFSCKVRTVSKLANLYIVNF